MQILFILPRNTGKDKRRDRKGYMAQYGMKFLCRSQMDFWKTQAVFLGVWQPQQASECDGAESRLVCQRA